MTKVSLEVWLEIQKKYLDKFSEKWQADLTSRSPDEVPKDPYLATPAIWKERFFDWIQDMRLTRENPQ